METVLNYGTLDDFRELMNVTTPKRLAQVFFSAVGRKADNYYPMSSAKKYENELVSFSGIAMKRI